MGEDVRGAPGSRLFSGRYLGLEILSTRRLLMGSPDPGCPPGLDLDHDEGLQGR